MASAEERMGIAEKLRKIGKGICQTLRGHQHQFVEFDESGDLLDETDGGEPCFRGCLTCGRIEVNPLGFQDDASLDNYLSFRETGGSAAERKVAAYLRERMASQGQEED
jgi:hypothetical protein